MLPCAEDTASVPDCLAGRGNAAVAKSMPRWATRRDPRCKWRSGKMTRESMSQLFRINAPAAQALFSGLELLLRENFQEICAPNVQSLRALEATSRTWCSMDQACQSSCLPLDFSNSIFMLWDPFTCLGSCLG